MRCSARSSVPHGTNACLQSHRRNLPAPRQPQITRHPPKLLGPKPPVRCVVQPPVTALWSSLPRLPAMPVADRRSSVAPPLPTLPAPAPATDRRGLCCATARAAPIPATPRTIAALPRAAIGASSGVSMWGRQRGHRRDRGSGAVRHSGAHAAAAMAEAHQVTAEGRGHHNPLACGTGSACVLKGLKTLQSCTLHETLCTFPYNACLSTSPLSGGPPA